MAWVSIALTVVLVAVTLGAYKVYLDLEGNIARKDIEDELGANRPPETGALNVLLVGSDTRVGAANKKYGPKSQNLGERTDTIILLHVSPNRDKATLVSFPRDSMVQIPECRNPQTKAVVAAGLRMINSAFNDGGIACTIRTIESLTQIHINHYVKVDFAGFKGIIDALKGIEICLPKDVDDKAAKFKKPAGRHVVMGEEALAYVRIRKNLGNGSDTDRIKRQQVFLTQVMKKATSMDLFTNPAQLLDFLNAATKSVEMDSNLTVPRLVEIAGSAQALTANKLQSITVPWEPYPANENHVQWKKPDADDLFAMIRSDIEVTPSAKPKSSSSASAKPAIKPAQIRVQVLNGTTTYGKAKEVADALSAQGFVVTHVGNAPLENGVSAPKSRVLYAERAAQGPDYASPLAAKMQNKVTPEAGKLQSPNLSAYTAPPTAAPSGTPSSAVTPGSPIIQLVIGDDWQGVKVPVKIPESVKGSVVNAKTNICQ
ncbi:cell envelope-related function transcriptional attenuator common domain-containing protein [Sinosporangium album]|uniref:Cell envelope-related function transcriptional attenuator common domain-containing protein n=1 Tax=Sinosporangium album TaxID=504805 RepID=A0A1G7VZX1_9ACTN|nr:LCP family protein [Sinosporangium album]SDG65326.1 cell envelope-related function transcriptional attenuator common domain-containing protein [Sinosporangium album]